MVSKIKLPELRTTEEVAVTSRVLDPFYIPPKKPVSKAAGDIAKALSGVIPQLAFKEETEEAIEKTEAEAQADVDFRNNNIKDFKTLVQKGDIPLGANPYYIKKYVNNTLREKAKIFNDELFLAYTNQGIDSQLGSSAFNDFYKKFATDFANKNGFAMYDNVNMAEGFIPFAEASRANLQSQHIQGRVLRIEKEQKEQLENYVESSILDTKNIPEENLDKGLSNYSKILDKLDLYDKQILYISQTIQKEADELIDLGLDAKVANDLIVAKVIKISKIEMNDDYLDVLNNIITNDNARLAGSYKDEILEAQYNIQDLVDQKEASNFIKYERNKKLRKEDTLNKFVNSHYFLTNIEAAIDTHEIYLAMEGQPPLTGEEVLMLKQVAKSYVNDLATPDPIILTEEVIQQKKQLYEDLALRPEDPSLLDRILGGWGVLYNNNEAIPMLNTYNARNNQETSEYFTDFRFTTVISGFTEELKVLKNEMGVWPEEIANLVVSGETQLYNEAYDLLVDLADPAYLEKNKLTTLREKKKHFFKLLEEERVEIIKIIIPNDLSDEQKKTNLNKLELITNPEARDDNPFK